MQTVEIMKQAIQEKDQRIAELEDTMKRYEFASQNSDKSIRADFAKKEMEHRFHQEDMILQAQLDQGLDANKAAIDNAKGIMDLKKTALQLDATKAKAGAEIVKANAQTVQTVAPMVNTEML